MVHRLIIAKVYHDRMRDFVGLVKDKWAPILKEHGGEMTGLWKNVQPDAHEVVGLMSFRDQDHLLEINQKLTADERFQNINAKMRPMLQSNEIRILDPL